jgi:protein-tyrosine-phosphatase
MTILLICTGNSCRSPMAEQILRQKLQQHGVEGIQVSSAGAATEDGFPAHPLAVGVCLDHGVKLNQHRSRRLTQNMVESADLILAMTDSHVNLLSQLYPEKAANTHLLKVYGRNSVPEDREIADPIGMDRTEYERCFRELETELERIVQILRVKHQRKKTC